MKCLVQLTHIFFVQLLRIILFYCFLYRIIVLWAQLCILSSYVISIKSNQYIYWYVVVCFPYTCFDVFGGYNPYSINFCIPDMDILSLSKFLNHVTTIFIHLQNSKAYKCPLFLFFQSHWSYRLFVGFTPLLTFYM